jgi:hypothetical protein
MTISIQLAAVKPANHYNKKGSSKRLPLRRVAIRYADLQSNACRLQSQMRLFWSLVIHWGIVGQGSNTGTII